MGADKGLTVGEVCGLQKPVSQQVSVFRQIRFQMALVVFVCEYASNGEILFLIVLMTFRPQDWALKCNMLGHAEKLFKY